MSVELYPDHKAILHFHQPLTVLEIDLLSYLTSLLEQEQFAYRQFHLYVKPTLHQSAFDFIIFEPNHALYIIQTPENEEQFLEKQEALDQNLNLSRREDAQVKTLHYIYNEALYDLLQEEESQFISPKDFENNQEKVEEIFAEQDRNAQGLSQKESRHIERLLNPNTNIQDFIPKTVPTRYEKHVKSGSQEKQKFKGGDQVGKTTLLVKRIIRAVRRLDGNGKILVVSGNPNNISHLKDLITAEDGRSLQELGIDVEHNNQLTPPKNKYSALFIDDAGELEAKEIKTLLEDFLVEMSPDNDYEYVVMANENKLPTVPKIMGRFITLAEDPREIDTLLQDSREIFLQILEA